MMKWLENKLKGALIVAVLGGTLFAYFGWSNGEHIRDVLARGVEATALISGAKVYTSDGSKSYSVSLTWKDAAGADRKAESVFISTLYAMTIIHGDRLTVGEARIKYIPDEPVSRPILVDDVGAQGDLDRLMLHGGLVAAAVGVIGLTFFFLLGRWRGKARTPYP